MPQRVCVIDIPGLSRELVSHIPSDTALGRWFAGKPISNLIPTYPAVTCSVQASLTTGKPPADHGIIANGLPTFRFPQDQALVDPGNFPTFRRQVSFWEQSNQFLDAPRFWKDRYRTALLFFQNSMPGFTTRLAPAADIILTPKPDHGPDGKLTSLCWSDPPDLVPQLFKQFGPFPLMNYWGPMAGIASSQWIAKAAGWVWKNLTPQLQWVYIPHLDYDLQRFGPDSPQAGKAVADMAAALDPLLESIDGKIIVLSEYVLSAVDHFTQPNRVLAEAGLLVTRPTPDGYLIDYDRSTAFALCDHQVAHLYTRDVPAARKALSDFEVTAPIPHRRSGDLMLTSDAGGWFDYRWWSRDSNAPAFARMVDIHRKPGYDPLELFFDPATKAISQNPALIKGSHGLINADSPAILAGDTDLPPACSVTDLPAILTLLLD